MGVLRAGPETEPPSGEAAGPGGTPPEWSARRRRWIEVAAFVLAAAALFTVYLRLSRTVPQNSDQANILLDASDLWHGNLLLHGWYLTDVSFYTTELPQYALLEMLFGVHVNTSHIAAAMTYTLVVVLAVLLARGGFTSRAAVTRMLITAGILLAPELGAGVKALILTVGHIGTAVPVLLIFLLLDRAPRRWWVPALTGLGLAWVLIADQLVLIVGVIPLALVCALRVAEAAVRERSLSRGFAARRYELSLIVAAGVAAGFAWVVERVLRALGGYILSPVPFKFTFGHLTAGLHSLWAVLQIFGADYRGLTGGPYYTALLHLVSVALVGLALVVVAWRFFAGTALVDQVLAVAIVANVALFVVTTAGSEGPHEIAVVAPFGAALAGRMLAGQGAKARQQQAGARAGSTLARRARLGAALAGVVVLLGYLGGLVHEVVQPASPPAFARVASWLQAHHLRYGLGGYWESSIVTVQTDGRVKVRALLKATLAPDLWLAKPEWYDPADQQANFVLLSSTPGFTNNWEPRALISKYFGRPAQVYNFGPYTVMVWDRNILSDLPP
ncbi:MAG TPA: hypothetical protein VMA97_00455 [Streptosporangiaceae bacterium]|nr:hypothetical protein [Streptosporangiaceae bacterium]